MTPAARAVCLVVSLISRQGCSLVRGCGHAVSENSRGVVPDERSPVACDRFVSRGGSLARGCGHAVSGNSHGTVLGERFPVTCDRLGSLVTSLARGFRQTGCGLSRWGGVMGLRVVGGDRRGSAGIGGDRRGSGWSAGRRRVAQWPGGGVKRWKCWRHAVTCVIWVCRVY